MRIEYHDQADCDLQEAAAYYVRRDPHIATAFLDTYDHCMRSIRLFPNAAPQRRLGLRASRIGRFPFSIVYAVRPDFVFILVIENLIRRPGYWHERLKDLPP